jgi:hypothetical protein
LVLYRGFSHETGIKLNLATRKAFDGVEKFASKGQFNHHNTGSFCVSRFTLILLPYAIQYLYNIKFQPNFSFYALVALGSNSVYDTETHLLRKMLSVGAFAVCAKVLVKMTSGGGGVDGRTFEQWGRKFFFQSSGFTQTSKKEKKIR